MTIHQVTHEHCRQKCPKFNFDMALKIMSLHYSDTCRPLYFNEKFEFSNFGVNWINHSVFEYWLILVRISRSKNLTPKGVHHFYFSCQKWHIYLELRTLEYGTLDHIKSVPKGNI